MHIFFQGISSMQKNAIRLAMRNLKLVLRCWNVKTIVKTWPITLLITHNSWKIMAIYVEQCCTGRKPSTAGRGRISTEESDLPAHTQRSACQRLLSRPHIQFLEHSLEQVMVFRICQP